MKLLGSTRNNNSNNVGYNYKNNNINYDGCNTSYMIMLVVEVIVKLWWHDSNSKMMVLVTCNYIFLSLWI